MTQLFNENELIQQTNSKLNISAVVVSLNEGKHLRECLKSLSFCAEIIVYDLESIDNTQTIAQEYATRYIKRRPVPIVEEIRLTAINVVRFNWILFVDPDEIFTRGLQLNISEIFKQTISNDIGLFRLPMRYHFEGKLLRGTYWGGIKYKIVLCHKKKTNYTGQIHRDISVKEGFKTAIINGTPNTYIKHLWVENKEHLISKHLRYLLFEGESMYNNGYKYSTIKKYAYTIHAWFKSYLFNKGFIDGNLGFYLSYFIAWYTYKKWQALSTYEHNLKHTVNY